MSQQIQITGGAKVRNLDGVLTGTSGVVNSLPINASNGIPQLDVNGKILVSQLPNSVMEYQGTWNVSTNTPTLANGTGNQGDVYLVEGAAVGGTAFNFGAGPITFFNGDQAIYSGSIWQRASGATGTVTSVAITESGDSLNITGSPITTSGTINIGFNGTNLQYVNGAGNLTTFPTLITSIGLSMPSAFSVANSPLTANGTIAVTGAGTTAQYIRGDGSLATFPTIATEAQRLITEVYNETGATLTKGTVVYINGGHGNLPTITKAIATGDATSAQTYGIVQADITDMNNGYVVVIGSLGDLDTQAYANGTQLYLSSTTAGAWTDVKQYAPAHLVYVGIVVRSHPTQGVVEVRIQNGFEMDELHNVSAQSPLNNQGLFYNTSTSLWENKSIATALGYTPANDALVVHLAGTETITGAKTFSTVSTFDIGLVLKTGFYPTPATGYVGLGSNGSGITILTKSGSTVYNNNFQFPNASNDYNFPNATGTLALTSDISYPVTSVFGRTGAVVAAEGDYSLTQLSDVTITSPTSSQLLQYNGTSWVNWTPNYITGNQTITLSGDVSGSGTTAITTTIGALKVTNAMLAGSIDLTTKVTGLLPDGNISSASTWNNKQGAITLTTTGTSGAATFSANTLNIPQYQGVLTNPVTGTGTTNYLPKFTASTTLGNSNISDSGTLITLGSQTYISTGGLGIGTTSLSSSSLRVASNITGATTVAQIAVSGQIQTDVTAVGTYFAATSSTATGGTLNSVVLYSASQGTFNSTPTNQYGFFVNASLISATNNYAFFSNMPAATNRWSFYSQGTANNYFAGSVGIGNTTLTGFSLNIGKTITGAVTSYGVNQNGIVQSGVTTAAYGYRNSLSTAAAAFTLPSYYHFAVTQATIGSTSAVTSQYGYFVDATLIGATNNYGFYGNIASGTNRWNLYMNGTADNYMAGSLGIGTPSPVYKLDVRGQGYFATASGTNQLTLGDTTNGTTSSIATSNNNLIFYPNGSTERMRITSDGNLLLGTTDNGSGAKLVFYSTTAAQQLKAAGTAPAITFSNTITSPTIGGSLGACTSAGQFLSGTAAGDMILINQFTGNKLYITNYSGGVYLTQGATSWTANSDIRLKNINSHIENAVEKLSTLQTINFSYKDDKTNKQNLGLIAQEVEKIFPELIDKNGDGMLGVRYTELVPVLIKAVQELKLEIETLKNK
jgi:hypothetical protein